MSSYISPIQMVKSIVSFGNLGDYNYYIKRGKILCEYDDMLMEIFGVSYGIDDEDKIMVLMGSDVKDYLDRLCSLLGDSGYSPICETPGGEYLVWVCIKKDSQISRKDWVDPLAKKDVRLIVHVDRLVRGRLHLSALLVEVLR